MPISIYAADATDVRFDPDTSEFREDAALDAPVFRIRALDYFDAQLVMAHTDDAAKVRACIAKGLLAIDGDEAAAAAFLARPRARLVNPLFRAIWDFTWGN